MTLKWLKTAHLQFTNFIKDADEVLMVFCRKIKINPNILTAFRIAFIPVIMLLIANNDNFLAAAYFGLAWILDLIDGPMARAHGKESQLGAFLDPLADKLLFLMPLILFRDQIWQYFFWGLITSEACLIGARIAKMVFNPKILDKKTDIRAAIAGKMKNNFEQTSVLILLLSRGNSHISAVVNIFLCVAFFLSLASLYHQIHKR